MPANRGDWSTYPNACRTPTSPGSMTTTREPAPTTVPRTATASPATRRRTAPATSLPMETPERDAGEDAPRAELRKEVRSPPARSGLPVSGPLRLGPRAYVAELFIARDALFGHQPFEHQLARRDHRARVLLPGQAPLVPEVDQARHHAEALEARLRALVHRELEGSTFVEPVDDVVHVGAAHAGFEGLARRTPDQVARDRFRTLQLPLVFELELAGDGGQRGVDVRDPRHDHLFLRRDGASL